ncbi:hypothetical protein [Caulobacter mirabilis]|uniref:hypothetical protein n=1 Tax=Caulobacter mirabilis TaxID=69666 RepID=UPI0012375472|nr:hypothetical protein [Caulobacter mirabilis]
MQLLNAQTELTSQIQELRRAGGAELLAAAEAQMTDLVGFQRRLASGTVSAAALRGEIVACVTAATNVAQQVRASALTSDRSASALDVARTEARAAVNEFADAYYRDRIFDPYLRFSSAEEEEAYRKREAERQQQIERAKAEGTPEGDLRAVRLSRDQLRDAGAHGATASPDYARWDERFGRAETALEAQIGRGSRERGNTAPSAQNIDPLDDIAPNSNIDPALLASLRSAGVTVADQSQSGHGVTQSAKPGPQAGIA